MASSDITESDDGSDLYECQVCLHFMMDKIPRTLHCLHTFCEDCLQKILNNNTIQCPTCRAVTTIAENDIKLLPVNFILNKMKRMKDEMKDMNAEIKDMKEVIDEMESVARATEESDGQDITKCDLCESYKALYKCKECTHFICSLCKSKHDSVLLFKTHLVHKKDDLSFNFCEPHGAKVTHACLKCGRTLCGKCVIFDHMEHRENIDCIESAIEKFKDEMNERREQIADKLECLTKKEKVLKGKTSVVLFRKAMLMEKMKSLRKQYEDVTTESENYQQMLNDFNETHKTCLELINDLKGKCMETDIEIFREYEDFRTRYEQALDLIETKLSFDNVSAVEGTCLKQGPKEVEIQNLSVQSLLVTVKESPTFKCQGQMVLIGKHALSASVLDPPHVVRIDEQGQVVSKYMAEEQGGQVVGVNVFEHKVYIAQERGITVLAEQDANDKHEFYHLQLHKDSKICVVDNTNILFSDPPNGSIHLYNTDLDVTEVLLEELNYPTYITTAITKSGRVFLITEQTDNMIKVFNSDFKLQNNIGDQDSKFNLPQSTVVTDMDTVLVCDEDHCRISHFNLDGTFLNNIEQGVPPYYPRGLAYIYPYLWTSNLNGGWLKCYELRKS